MCVLLSDRPETLYKCQWGLCVREQLAEHFGIARNNAVRVIEGGKAFIWNFAQDEPDDLIDTHSMGKHALFDCLRSLGLRPRGLCLSQVEVKLKPQNTHKWSCGRVIVPLAD